MPRRTVEQILEELTGLQLAWPEAPVEVWMVLHDELAEAIMRQRKTEVRHGTEAIRRTPRPGRRNRPIG